MKPPRLPLPVTWWHNYRPYPISTLFLAVLAGVAVGACLAIWIVVFRFPLP